MKLDYRAVDYESIQDCQILAKWENDPEIRHLIHKFYDAESYESFSTVESVMSRKAHATEGKDRSVLVMREGLPIAEASFLMNPGHLATKATHTAWLSIVIGEKSARGMGLGALIMNHIELLATQAGARQFEIGVFEFNAPALRLYTRIGYREIERIPNFTYWNGKTWTDIRMFKVAS